MIKVKRVYVPPAPDDGRRFLVDRVWPRGISKDAAKTEAWVKEAAPSNELRRWFGHDPQRWAEFARRYRRELESRPDVLAPLLQAAREGDVTLVYSARDEQHNQAVVLRDVLQDLLERARHTPSMTRSNVEGSGGASSG
jgi:uncharacterized protein YeaO (DUF488 family)